MRCETGLPYLKRKQKSKRKLHLLKYPDKYASRKEGMVTFGITYKDTPIEFFETIGNFIYK